MIELKQRTVNITEEMRIEISHLIGHAISLVDEIESSKSVKYANEDNYSLAARRKFTLKDAKPKAKLAQQLLRKAWKIIDPPFTTFEK